MKVYTVWYIGNDNDSHLWTICSTENGARFVKRTIEEDYNYEAWYNEEEVQD